MSGLLRTTIDWLAYAVARCLIGALQVLSPETGARLADLGGGCLARLPLRRRVVDQNLHRVFPAATDAQLHAMRHAMWRHLLLMLLEIAWAPRRLHRTNWKRHVTIPNKQRVLASMLGRRPVVLVTGHYGNFEIGGYVTGLFGLSTMTIARPLDNRFLDAYITRFRGSKGQQLVSKEGSAALVDAHLKAGGTLTILADQYAGVKGCWADFLGQPASCHKSLALFTLVAGAPMVVLGNRRLDRPMQFELDCFGIADPQEPGRHLDGVREMTQWYNDCLGAAIARAPEQYWWLHRRWREDGPPQRKVRQAA